MPLVVMVVCTMVALGTVVVEAVILTGMPEEDLMEVMVDQPITTTTEEREVE